MAKKYARICWNTHGWRRPSGDATFLETESYVSQHGFGHEEWLFNFEWTLDSRRFGGEPDCHYGYTQSLGKFYDSYVGQFLDVLLYAFRPDKEPVFCARIRRAYIPFEDELRWARDRYVENGWLLAMKDQVRTLGYDPNLLDEPRPSYVLNMRYRKADADEYEPKLVVPLGHKIRRMFRYHPLNWDDGYDPDRQ